MNSKKRYRLSESAAESLENIFNHTLHRFGLAKAKDYGNSLLNTLDIIAENPELGRLHSDLSPPARVHPHREHVLMYILDDEGIPLITRIYNARQNWKQRHSTTVAE